MEGELGGREHKFLEEQERGINGTLGGETSPIIKGGRRVEMPRPGKGERSQKTEIYDPLSGIPKKKTQRTDSGRPAGT